MKTYFALFIMFFTFSAAFAQNAKKKPAKEMREITLTEEITLNSLLDIKTDFVLEDYQITLANKGMDEIFIWRKGTFPEDQLIEMIQENMAGDYSVLYIENVKYTTPRSNEIVQLTDPIKVRIH